MPETIGSSTIRWKSRFSVPSFTVTSKLRCSARLTPTAAKTSSLAILVVPSAETPKTRRPLLFMTVSAKCRVTL